MKVISCMAYLRKDDENASFRMFDHLLLKTDGVSATRTRLVEMIEALRAEQQQQ